MNILTNRGLDIIPALSEQGMEYPADVGLCGCILDGFLIHHPAYTDKAVLMNLDGREIISVNQGYSKCAVSVVNENAVITSDDGIAAAAEAAGIDVLRIRPGHIALDGFDFGFIGGSTFKLSAHELAFTGTLYDHPGANAILDFLSRNKIEPAFLTEGPLFDVGSAVPIFEI